MYCNAGAQYQHALFVIFAFSGLKCFSIVILIKFSLNIIVSIFFQNVICYCTLLDVLVTNLFCKLLFSIYIYLLLL